MTKRLVLALSLLFSLKVAAAPPPNLSSVFVASPADFISAQVKDPYPFFGLATYLNAAQYYLVDSEGMRDLDRENSTTLQAQQWLAIAGRFNVLVIQAPGLSISITETDVSIENENALYDPAAVVQLTTRDQLHNIAGELDRIRYAHLWRPLAILASAVESALVMIQSHLATNWGLAIVVLSLLVRVLLLPVTIMTERFAHRVSEVQALLAPVLEDIKANYDGEQAHERMMAAHRDLGVTPFYTLKPMLATMIQIPVLIAVFNALGEMPQLAGQSVGWVDDLAYPDVIAPLPFSVPMLGNTLHALPFVMAFISIVATLMFSNPHASETMMARQRRNLFLMSLAFLLLFYPFPAAMVYYWTLATILSAAQQKLISA